MPTLTIPEDVALLLAERAALHGRTADAEAREILEAALDGIAPTKHLPDNLFDAIRAIVEPVGGVDLDIPQRKPGSRPTPSFN